MQKRIIGKDAKGTPRVWGDSIDEAKIAAEEYVRDRPDTGPLRRWTFTPENRPGWIDRGDQA